MNKKTIQNILSTFVLLGFIILLAIDSSTLLSASAQISTEECDVIVNGGSTAALFAGITSAKEGKVTCLIEPTDWLGGQLTSSGVPAIDWQWMTNINPTSTTVKDGADGNTPHKLRENNNYLFYDWIKSIPIKGTCSVSRDCFLSTDLLPIINSYVATLPNLKVYYQTVPKSVTTEIISERLDNWNNKMFDVKNITSVQGVQRTYKSTVPQEERYKKRLSDDIENWYSYLENEQFTKRAINFTGRLGKMPVIVEASEYGDMMVLAEAPYLQGNETFDGSIDTASEYCGQSTTFAFNMKMYANPVFENVPPKSQIDTTYGTFDFGSGTWDTAWNYRRLKGTGSAYSPTVAPDQISVMNWKNSNTRNNGNDYAKIYMFDGYSDAKAEIADWKGGVKTEAIRGAEDVSYNFYYFMKEQEPRGNGNRLRADNASMGTNNGLYKMPYMRDIRRSIGIDNYLLKTSETLAQKPTGYRFMDRIATANYPFDIHPIDNCTYSNDDLGLNFKQGKNAEPYPFYISFRSLTNKAIANMVVGGKGIAQSFKVSAATRLQPGEATTGTAAGAAAAYMHTKNLSTYDIVEPPIEVDTYRSSIAKVQFIIQKYQTIDWTIGGVKYPSDTEYVENIRTNYYCPNGSVVDLAEGWCYDGNNAYGPFPKAMVDKCTSFGGGPACTELKQFQAGDKIINAQRYSKLFARKLRGDGVCYDGTTRATDIRDHCIEQGTPIQVYGPFTIKQVETCNKKPTEGGLGGGNACYTNRYNYNFTKKMLAQ
ncbi:MAG: FAD-dependent oxidoreductase [Patescibacteria group bacterium]